jgi:hypothetical protein
LSKESKTPRSTGSPQAKKRKRGKKRKGGPYDAGIRRGSKIYYVLSLGAKWKEPALKKAKSIQGSRWSPSARHWTVPYSDSVLEQIPSTFEGSGIEAGINPSLHTGELRKEPVSKKYGQRTTDVHLRYEDLDKIRSSSDMTMKREARYKRIYRIYK